MTRCPALVRMRDALGLTLSPRSMTLPTVFRRSLAGLLLLVLLTAAAGAAEPDPEGIAFFEKRVRPILVAHCYECHSVDSKEKGGNLLLDSRPGILDGGDSGPALIPGDPGKSLLITA